MLVSYVQRLLIIIRTKLFKKWTVLTTNSIIIRLFKQLQSET